MKTHETKNLLSSRNQAEKEDGKLVVSVLDVKRRQNLEICLKGLGLLDNISLLLDTVSMFDSTTCSDEIGNTEDILMSTAPKSFSQKYLSPDALEIVVNLYPSPAEQQAVLEAEKKIQQDSGKVLGKVKRLYTFISFHSPSL